jgi:hypothetical protein
VSFTLTTYRFILALLLLPLLGAALSLQQSFIFDGDGGCRASYTWSVPRNALGVIEASREYFAGKNCGNFLDSKAVTRHFTSFDGIKVLSSNRYETENAVICRVLVFASDARKAFAEGAFGALRLIDSPAAPGDLEFSGALPEFTADGEGTRAALCELLGGVELTLTVTTPTAVIEATGEKKRFDQVQWHLTSPDYLKGICPKIFVRW